VLIFAMAKMAQLRGLETGGHLIRMQKYVRALAEQARELPALAAVVDDSYIRMLERCVLLHDIGKVGIPDSVLLKAGRLSDREFEIMKTHAMLGAQTLDAALRMFPQVKFLRMARDIAATHHERFDGSGYPAGLAGDDIPLSGAIVALADVYDALTSKRVYKAAFGHEIARSMIVEESGSHFHPEIVNAFLQIEPKFVTIKERFNEGRTAAA
jgi:cyclic di-GMP phosphodiesterase